MKSKLTAVLLTCSLIFVFGLIVDIDSPEAKKPYRDNVNATCGTSYGCDLCHIDPKGGGDLNADGIAFLESGYNACYFCPEVPGCGGTQCTDNDADGYYAESNCGTGVDCDDNDPAVNPGAVESCSDGIDNDCNNKIDCADGACANEPSCFVQDEICDDGIDNDNDNKIDCSDKKDCNKDPACGGGGATPEICNDGIDNDGDNKVDCADKKDCNKDPAC